MKRNFFLTIATLTLCLFGTPSEARAQDAPPTESSSESSASEVRRYEFGVHYSSVNFDDPNRFGEFNRTPAVGARVTYNLTRHLALEAEVNVFLFKTRGEGFAVGGHPLQGQFGLKAGKRWKRFGIFAKARPGFVSFSETIRPQLGESVIVGDQQFFLIDFVNERKTHLSLDVGGAAEFYHTKRLFTRVDFGDTVLRYGPHPSLSGDEAAPVSQSATRHEHNFQFGVGVGVRLGPRARGDEETASPAGRDSRDESLPRFEAGAHFTALSLSPIQQLSSGIVLFGPPRTLTHFGLGGRFTLNLTRHLALEAEQNFFPSETDLALGASGHLSQGQYGLKAGKRFKRFGIFAKARPGFVSFSRSFSLLSTQTITVFGLPRTFGTFGFRRRTYFSGDVGGVFEIYPSRRWLVRFDAGDTVIAYGARHADGLSLSQPIKTAPAETRHNLQFSSGVAFRFF